MFERRRRRILPLSATVMADLSFMLLVFFLITSSMDTDRGLARGLPPGDDTAEPLRVAARNILTVRLTADGRLLVDGEELPADALTQRTARFVTAADEEGPETSEREVHLLGRMRVSDCHVVSIEADSRASYETYLHLQNALSKAYVEVRDALARQRFGHPLAQCSDEEREALAVVYPVRISEQPVGLLDEEGGEP